jgi:hypothetical protein
MRMLAKRQGLSPPRGAFPATTADCTQKQAESAHGLRSKNPSYGHYRKRNALFTLGPMLHTKRCEEADESHPNCRPKINIIIKTGRKRAWSFRSFEIASFVVAATLIIIGPTPIAGYAQTVAAAIARIRSGPHAEMPPAQAAVANGPEGEGMTIENGTAYPMRVYFSGPIQRSVSVPKGRSAGVELVVGNYEVAVEVVGETPGVRIMPFYGRQTYEGNTHYWLKFYLQ